MTHTSDGTHLQLAHDYAGKAAAMGQLADSAKTPDWARPSPCEGWTAREVVLHLIDTQAGFLADRGLEPPAVDRADPARAWEQHSEGVAALLADPAVGATGYDGWFGRTTVAATMAQFYGWDMLVHRWDLGRALGRQVVLTDAELDEIEAALPGFGDQLYGEGICRPAVQVEPHQPRQVQVLAVLGRDAR